MIPVDQRTEADKITASNLLTSLEFLKQEKNNLKNSYEINKMNWVVQQTQTLIKELSNTETREKISKLDLKVYSIDEILNLNKEGKNGN
jgi:predicted DNA-binding ribbon-helix-helix protein